VSRGTIRRRGRNSFELRFELERVDGKRQRRCVSVKGGTLREAQRKLAELLVAADRGTLAEPSQDTVGRYLTHWLDSELTLAPKTKERYGEFLTQQIAPHLGDVKLQKLTPERLEQWHAALITAGLAPRTVGHAHRVLSRGLRRAVENGTLSRNVASIRKPPKVEEAEVEILTAAEIDALVAGLEGHRFHPIASLALATGARRGELLGLQWSDIDLDRGTVRIERSVEETAAGLRLKPPKTRRGRRNTGLPAEAVAMLRAHKVAQMELRLALGQGGSPTLVFSTLEGELLSPNGLSRDWRRVCRARKLPPCPFHALRHTHASLLLRAGVDVLTVSRRLGHSKAAITLDVYGHLIEGADAAAAKALEGVLK
jgi:integrase